MNGPRPVVLIGLGLTVVGGYLLTQDLFHERSARILPPRLDYLMFFGPVIFLVGLTGFLTELLRRSRKTKQVFLQGLRILGVAMLLVGGYPWPWVSVLTGQHGGRPGNEAEGMAGFLIMLFVGLPGLLLTLLSCAIIASRSKALGQTPDKSVKRPAARLTLRGVVGAVGLGIVGTGLLSEILCGVFFGQFVFVATSVGAVGLGWLLTRGVRVIWLRILLRAFTIAVFLWPFIPHPSVEWSSPWPPAGYYVWTALRSGKPIVFELVSIHVATLVMWLAGSAVYHDRHRNVAG